jgi:DNA-binding NarL/FixJ family response regulator
MTKQESQEYIRRLRPREVEVLQCLASGWSHQETAEELGTRVQTIRNYCATIRRTLSVKQHLAAWLREHPEMKSALVEDAPAAARRTS